MITILDKPNAKATDFLHTKHVHNNVIDDTIKFGFRNPGDVRLFLNYGMTNVKVSTKTNCRKPEHCSQVSFLNDVFLGKVADFLVWACRGGSKTFFLGLIMWVMCGRYANIEAKLLGGSGEQSEKGYKAMGDFWKHSELEDDYLVEKPMKTSCNWKNGSNVGILTASSKSVRGPHPQILGLDEVDEMDEDIYESALSQPQSKNGFSAMTGIASTNHKQTGTMSKALKAAKNGAYKVYKWCIWDILESCKDYNCSTCKLTSFCPGKHMKQADGYYKIDDFVKKLDKISAYILKLDWFCEIAGSKDCVYTDEWDEDIHVIDRPFDENYEVWTGHDWGGVHPFIVQAWQNFPDIGWVMVDEVCMANTTSKRVALICMERPWWKKIKGGVPDPSRNDLISEWKEDYHVPMILPDNKIESGIEAVKNVLRPILGPPLIHVNKSCINAINEFTLYKNKNGIPVDKNNHSMDVVRYIVKTLIASNTRKSKTVGGSVL